MNTTTLEAGESNESSQNAKIEAMDQQNTTKTTKMNHCNFREAGILSWLDCVGIGMGDQGNPSWIKLPHSHKRQPLAGALASKWSTIYTESTIQCGAAKARRFERVDFLT